MKAPILTMRDYLRMIFRRGRALFLPVFLSALLVVPLLMIIPPKFQAEALVKRKDLAMINNTSGNLMSRGGPSVSLNTLREEILTWTSLDRVIRDLRLDVDLKTAAQWQEKYEDLRKSITFKTVATAPGVDLIRISAVCATPKLAQDIANKIADNYVENSRLSSRQDIQSALKFYQEGVDDSLRKLRQTERELDKYTQEHYTDLPDVKKGLLDRLFSLHTEQTTHTLLLTTARNRLAEIEKQLGEIEKLVTSEVTSEENPATLELQNQLVQRQKILEAMLVRLTSEHPDIVQLKSEIEMIKQQLVELPHRVPGAEREIINPVYQQLAMSKLDVQQQIRAEEGVLTEIGAQIAANEADVRQVVQEEKHYTDLLRDKREFSDLYDEYHRNLIAAQGRLQAETGSYGTQVEMIDRAREPAAPYRAIDIQMALTCLAGGFCVGIALMFLLEFSDHSLRSADDAATAISLPILGNLTTINEEAARAAERRVTALMVAIGLLAGAGLIAGVWAMKMYWPLAFQSIQRLF